MPVIGSMRMAKLQPAHVQQVVDTATTSGLAPRTVAGVYRTLDAALRQAMRWQLLSVNPAAAIEPPRAERAKLETPEAAKVAKVLDAARGTRLYVPLAILASTGLRRGELLALRWRDVELDRRVEGESAPLLRVTASLQRIDGQDVFLPPKTDRARRTVGLPPAAVALLRRHRREQLERRVLLGEAWTDLDLVIDRGDGEPFPRIRSRGTGTASLTGSACRISGSMICAILEASVHPKVVSEALGHSSVASRWTPTSTCMPTMQDAGTTRAIEEAIGGTLAAGLEDA